MTTKIKVYGIKYTVGSSDAGEGYEFQCPECGDTIKWAEYKWWDCKCSCGYVWEIEMYAYPVRKED